MAIAIVPPIINPIIPNKILSKVIFMRGVFSALQVTSLYMARSVQIRKLFSDEARAEFFNFSYYLFSISQIKKFGGLANIP